MKSLFLEKNVQKNLKIQKFWKKIAPILKVEMVTQETNPVIISLYFTLEPQTVSLFHSYTVPQTFPVCLRLVFSIWMRCVFINSKGRVKRLPFLEPLLQEGKGEGKRLLHQLYTYISSQIKLMERQCYLLCKILYKQRLY